MATESKTLVLLALIAFGVIASVKFIAAAISGSSAMQSAGFHEASSARRMLPRRMLPMQQAVIDRVETAMRAEVREATRIFVEFEPGL